MNRRPKPWPSPPPSIALAPHPLEDFHPTKLWFIVTAEGASLVVHTEETIPEGSGSFTDWAKECGALCIDDYLGELACAPGLYLWEGVAGWSRTSALELQGRITYVLSPDAFWQLLGVLIPTPQ